MSLRVRDSHWNRRSALGWITSSAHAGADPPGIRPSLRAAGWQSRSSHRSSSRRSGPGFFAFAPFRMPSEPGTAGHGSRPPGAFRQKRGGAGGTCLQFARNFSEIARSDDEPLKGTDDT